MEYLHVSKAPSHPAGYGLRLTRPTKIPHPKVLESISFLGI
jgi:hypothetical protein